MLHPAIVFTVILVAAVTLSIIKNKLTIPAGFTAALLAVCIFAGTGFTGIALLGAFFMIGVFVTSFNMTGKERAGLAERDKGRRKPGQVLANGGVAGLISLSALAFPAYKELCVFLVACSFSAATADTVSSELGMLYGKRFYNIVTLKKDTRGENGVVSIEGTLLGIAGSCVVAVIFALLHGWAFSSFIIIIIAGTIGNLVDSVLGATLERENRIGNDVVNTLNTLSGAIAGWILFLW